jgi:hypothetical protein
MRNLLWWQRLVLLVLVLLNILVIGFGVWILLERWAG